MKKETPNNKFTLEELDIWSTALDRLNEHECEFVNLNIISTSNKGYFPFWNNETKKLISSFLLISQDSLDDSEKNNDIMIKSGFTVNSIKYSKTKRMEINLALI